MTDPGRFQEQLRHLWLEVLDEEQCEVSPEGGTQGGGRENCPVREVQEGDEAKQHLLAQEDTPGEAMCLQAVLCKLSHFGRLEEAQREQAQ